MSSSMTPSMSTDSGHRRHRRGQAARSGRHGGKRPGARVSAPPPSCRTSTSAIPKGAITALIGPTGSGKTTFLRSLNRMNDRVAKHWHKGEVLLEGSSIYAPGVQLMALRRRVGMVFQRPNPFPMSIGGNILSGREGPPDRQQSPLPDHRRSAAQGGRALGRPFPTGSARRLSTSPGDSSSSSASRVPSQSAPRSCCWTNRPLRWTRSPPRTSRR